MNTARVQRQDLVRFDKKGGVRIPAHIRKHLGFKEGAVAIAEERDGTVVLRPAEVVEVEIYTPERKAEFLLGNAVSHEHYEAMCQEVRTMGLDPKKIKHRKPR